MYTITNIFPTTLISTKLSRPISSEEMDIVNKYKLQENSHRNYGNLVSNDYYVLDKEKGFSEIRDFIQQGIDNYVDIVLKPQNELDFYITQSWLNYTEPGEIHHKHNHPNSIISGVFYFNAVQTLDRITFYNVKDKQIEIQPREFTMYNSPSWWYPVETGVLLLFPSDLVHAVDMTMSDQTRISLAFNVFAKGLFGSEDGLTALHL